MEKGKGRGRATFTRRGFLTQIALASPLTYTIVKSGVRAAAAETPGEQQKGENLDEFLKPLVHDNGLPAIATAASKKGIVVATGAVGVRKIGDPARVTIADKFHIGSCTKAMTATLAAMLVEQGKIGWDDSLEKIFPERAAKMNAAYRPVTLEMLLTHRSGAAHDGTNYGPNDAPVTAQRLMYLESVVSKKPKTEPGKAYSYSNAGYIIAGAMLERVTGSSWEELMQKKLFGPIGMASAGFGAPSKPIEADQPWGHVLEGGKFVPRYGDNHRALGPAGTVHCGLVDYLKFADLHATNGSRPTGLLAPQFFERLHEPVKDNYAMGWGVVERPWAKGRALTHHGSNTMNYFIVWIAPKIELCIAIASNASSDEMPKILDKVAGELVKRFAT
jgi:CubicO group peptidase (beta-lactamase class C family)